MKKDINFQNHINKLKLLTLTNRDQLRIPANYFLDHFSENKFLIENSLPITQNIEFYKDVLDPIIKIHDGVAQFSSRYLMEIKQYDFIHGPVMLSNNRVLVMYYFEDILWGLIMLSSFDKKMHFYRITLQQVTGLVPIRRTYN